MLTKPIHSKLLYGFFLLIALLLPLYGPDPYMFQIIIMSLIFAIAVLAMNMIIGYTGQASLAHGAFFGFGAYAVAIMTKSGISFWLALPAAASISALIGLVIGPPALRTRGSYFAIVTLAFGVVVWVVAGNWVAVTGGQNGIFGIPRPSPIPIPFVGEIEFFDQIPQYYLVLAFLLLTLFIMHRLIYSIFGLTFMAIRNNEPLADAVGINTFTTKLISFVTANFFAGLAGGLYVSIIGAVSPSAASYMLTFNFLIFLILGGMATLSGSVIGAFAIPIIMELLQEVGHFRMLIFGSLLVVTIIYFPRGFVGGIRQLNQKIAVRRQKS